MDPSIETLLLIVLVIGLVLLSGIIGAKISSIVQKPEPPVQQPAPKKKERDDKTPKTNVIWADFRRKKRRPPPNGNDAA